MTEGRKEGRKERRTEGRNEKHPFIHPPFLPSFHPSFHTSLFPSFLPACLPPFLPSFLPACPPSLVFLHHACFRPSLHRSTVGTLRVCTGSDTVFHYADAGNYWHSSLGLGSCDAVIIRPDGHVASIFRSPAVSQAGTQAGTAAPSTDAACGAGSITDHLRGVLAGLWCVP